MIEISRYSPVQSQQWNQFVAESKNGTFLFDRRYMDYHCDRFEDMSFCFYKKHNLSAVLPANIVGDTLYSHAGLTYGGLICNHKMTATDVCECFDLPKHVDPRGNLTVAEQLINIPFEVARVYWTYSFFTYFFLHATETRSEEGTTTESRYKGKR